MVAASTRICLGLAAPVRSWRFVVICGRSELRAYWSSQKFSPEAAQRWVGKTAPKSGRGGGRPSIWCQTRPQGAWICARIGTRGASRSNAGCRGPEPVGPRRSGTRSPVAPHRRAAPELRGAQSGTRSSGDHSSGLRGRFPPPPRRPHGGPNRELNPSTDPAKTSSRQVCLRMCDSAWFRCRGGHTLFSSPPRLGCSSSYGQPLFRLLCSALCAAPCPSHVAARRACRPRFRSRLGAVGGPEPGSWRPLVREVGDEFEEGDPGAAY